MKNLKYFAVAVILAALMITFGCVTPSETVRKARKKIETTVEEWFPETLAILPFENCSVTDPDQFAPLSKGISAMLMTDLKQSGTRLKLIERQKIRQLLGEISLSQSGSIDESTLVQAGKMLGAQTIACGSFIVLGNRVRIDTRIVRVETSEVVMAESITGASDTFLDLVTMLAQKIADSLNVTFSPKAGVSEGDIKAAVFFSKGLEALDRGDKQEARRLFEEAVRLDPAYKGQVDNVEGLDDETDT